MRSSSFLLSFSSLASLTSAHFLLNYPPSIGFDDAKENIGPCGGFTPDLSNSSQINDFHVGGDAIALMFGHPQGTWLFRVTEDETAQSGWEQIFPMVMQSGLGNFCEPQVTVPDKFVGKKGVIGVVVDAPDGLLFQCAAVNFVAGTNSKPPSSCKNSTIQVSFADDPKLASLAQGGSSSSSSSSASNSSQSSGTKSSSPSASPTHNAAASLQGAFSLLTMALIGGALVI